MENRHAHYRVKPGLGSGGQLYRRRIEEIGTAVMEADAGWFANDEESPIVSRKGRQEGAVAFAAAVTV
jgi:hypothetical protein